MEMKENLELVDVELDSKKAVLTFLDAANAVIHTVNWNKQVYENNKWVDSAEKSEKVDGWARDYFGCEYSELPSKVGITATVYVYDNYCSMWESNSTTKFTADMKGEIYQTEIKDILVEDFFIKIQYEIDGKTYESKQTLGKYLENVKRWYKDPQKEVKEKAKFEDKYGVPVEEAATLIGLPIIVECKSAFGEHYYGDIKKPKRK